MSEEQYAAKQQALAERFDYLHTMFCELAWGNPESHGVNLSPYSSEYDSVPLPRLF